MNQMDSDKLFAGFKKFVKNYVLGSLSKSFSYPKIVDLNITLSDDGVFTYHWILDVTDEDFQQIKNCSDNSCALNYYWSSETYLNNFDWAYVSYVYMKSWEKQFGLRFSDDAVPKIVIITFKNNGEEITITDK